MRVRKIPSLALVLLCHACSDGGTETAHEASSPSGRSPDAGSADSLNGGAGATNVNTDGAGEGDDATSDPTAPADPGGATDGPMNSTDPQTTPVTDPGSSSAGETSLGAACDSDEDCEADLECLIDSEFFGGRIAKGLCTTRCTEFEACAAFDPLAVCLVATQGNDDPSDDEGYCLQGCTPQGPTPKCHDRVEAVCNAFSENAAGCLPWCHSDADCGDDQHCNPASGLCQPDPAEGKADGEPCDEPTECLGGICDTLTTSEFKVCSSFCSVRLDTFSCHQPADVSAPAESICLPLTLYDTANDIGICLPACDTDGDCADGTHCLEMEPEFELEFGRIGMCWASEADGENDEATSGQPDGGTPASEESAGDAAAP